MLTDDGSLVPAGIAAVFANIELDDGTRVISLEAKSDSPEPSPSSTQNAQQNSTPRAQTVSVSQTVRSTQTAAVESQTGLASQAEERNPSPIHILMYHEIGDGPTSLYVREQEFEAQMKYLYESEYNVISMDTAMKVMRGEASVENGVVITFDDGYRTFYEKAWGVLKKYNFPATVYVICDLSASHPGYISWEQMRFLQAKWIDIGSHSISHKDMSLMAEAELDREISESKSRIEEELLYPCKYFSYPSGHYANNVIEKIKRAGYDNAVTIGSGKVYAANSDFYRLPRLFVRRCVTPEKLEKILTSGVS